MKRMDACVDAFRKRLVSIAILRANTDMLSELQVSAYGGESRLRDVASCTVATPRTLLVQVWDVSLIRSVEKSVREFNNGLGIRTDGNNILVTIPSMSEERRLELIKTARTYAEEARVGIRQVRQDLRDKLKDQPAHAQNRIAKDVQARTDKCIDEINDILKRKEKDIIQG